MNTKIRRKSIRRYQRLKQQQALQKKQSPQQETQDDTLTLLKEKSLAQTPKSGQPDVVMALQRTIGNAATMNMVQRWGWMETNKTLSHIPKPAPIQRAGGAAGGSPAPAPADPVPAVLDQLRASSNLMERNTAQIIDTGRVKWWYIDQCPPDPATPFKPGDQVKTVIHPGTGEKMNVSVTADGFQWNGIFIKRAASEARVKTIIIHEINHAVRGDHESDHDAASFGRYKDEFQAYWVAEFAGEANLNTRAQNIKNHILTAKSYQPIQNRYNTDTAFQAQVDAHTRPDGNVLNSVRWQVAEQSLEKNDKAMYFAAIKVMADEELEAVRANTDFMKLTRDKLNNAELLTAYLILYKFPKSAVMCSEAMEKDKKEVILAALSMMTKEERKKVREYKSFMDHVRDSLKDYDSLLKAYLIIYDFHPLALGVVDAMTGAGTDEETIYKLLLDIPSPDRKRLREYESFMWRLRDDLNAAEMEVVEKILKM